MIKNSENTLSEMQLTVIMSYHKDSLPPPRVTDVIQNNILNPVSKYLTNRSILITELLNILLSFDA